MADFYGVEYAALYRTTPPSRRDASLFGGKLRVMHCTFEAAALAAGSVIHMAKLPKGAVVVGGLSTLSADALGTGVTLQVGDYYSEAPSSDDDDRYLAATGYNTANLCGHLSLVDGQAYELEYDADIIITTGGAAATGTIKLALVYSMP